jgi:ribosome-associated protein
MIERKALLPELQFRFSRSSGPGGQNVNKVNSKVTLIWTPKETQIISASVLERFLKTYSSKITLDGEILISSDRTRDQKINKEDTIDRLMRYIEAIFVAPKKRKKTKPSKSAVRKRLEGKKKDSITKKGRGKFLE